MDLPKYHELMWPTLCALRELGGSGSIAEIEDLVVGAFPEDIQEIPHDGFRSEIAYRVAWARTYLKYIGAVENSARGVWGCD